MDTYIAVYILFTSAIGSGVTMNTIPSIGAAKESGKKIFSIIEEQSKIDSRDPTGEKVI